MVIMPMSALFMMIQKEGVNSLMGSISVFMFVLGLVVVGMSFRFIALGPAPEPVSIVSP